MTMANIYKTYHRGAKAIFWLPTRAAAHECSRYLNDLIGQDVSIPITGETGSAASRKLMDQAVERFKTKTDPLKAVCVVFRLREGFDFDELAFGFDCS